MFIMYFKIKIKKRVLHKNYIGVYLKTFKTKKVMKILNFNFLHSVQDVPSVVGRNFMPIRE